MNPFGTFAQSEVTVALSIFFATFVYEDGATLLAATLAVTGRLNPTLGLASAFLGIWIGDIGLYATGATIGRRLLKPSWAQRLVSTERLKKAEQWFSRRGASALVISRFIPGSRLPLYLIAGTLNFPSSQFATITGICALLWVGVIFTVWRFAQRSALSPRMPTFWLLVALMLIVPWVLSKIGQRAFERIRIVFRRYKHWEFWPAWLFYPPVAMMCGWLGLRYGGFSLPTAANPGFRNGGIVGESKAEILQMLMQAVPEYTAAGALIPANYADRKRLLEQIRQERGISLPFVLKPNVGQRGAGFKLISSVAEAETYLDRLRVDVIVQRYAKARKEAGIFYYRFPGEKRGKIFAMTEKIFPIVIGDGRRTFEELLQLDPRASLIADTYLTRFPELHGKVLPEGETLRLVEAGNHCQGCIFRDGGHLITDALRDCIDGISQKIPGFFVGRYDIRYESDEDLRAGRNFTIIELNGAASEATNIYDARNSLLSAYRTLYQQWKIIYAIGDANRTAGHRPTTIFAVVKDLYWYWKISAAYPIAD